MRLVLLSMWTMWEKKMGHTASERSVLGSKSNFSPGASLWFCTWSSLSSASFSKPSTTAILLPPRYLQEQETRARRQPLSDRRSISQHEQTGLLTAWRASADERGSLYEWCCCSVGTDGWGWRRNPGCKCVWFGCRKGKGQRGSCTRRYHPETHETKNRKSKIDLKDEAEQRVLLMYTYNILYILVRKVEVGENSQVLLWGRALLPFNVASRFSYQLCGQTDHDGSGDCSDR